MNLTQITQQLGAPPEPADGAGVIGLVVLAGIFALAVASPWFKKGSRGPVVAAAILVAIIAAAFTASIAYTVRDGARASREKSVWDAQASGWAEERYGVDAGMAGLGSVSITDALFKATGCPTDDRCYTGTVLIGDTLTPVTFVLIDETPILVSGGEESQKELPVISDTAGAAEQTDRR